MRRQFWTLLLIGLVWCVAAGFAQQAAPEAAPAEGAITGKTLFDTFQRGGLAMWPILLCSIVAMAFVFERFVSLRRSIIFPKTLADDVTASIREGNTDEALALCEKDCT